MKKSIFLIGAVVFITALFSACSPRIAGSWQVVNYKMNFGKADVSLNNIGFIAFDKDGSGTQHFEYTLLGRQIEFTSSFSWHMDKNTLIIESGNPLLNHSWRIVERKLKYQKWEAEDGSDKVIELRKQASLPAGRE